MARDDELQSVRIEVDGAPEPTLHVPNVGGPAGGPSRWPIALVVLLVAAVGAVLFLLSPDGDEAADGTDRAAPTTSVPESNGGEPGAGDDGEDGETQGLAESIPVIPLASPPFELEEPLTPVEADVEIAFGQIIGTPDGWLAMASAQSPGNPRLLRSLDGVVWNELDATVLTASGEAPDPNLPVELFLTNGGNALISVDTEADGFRSSVALSTNAVDWTIAEPNGPIGSRISFVNRPFAIRNGSLIGLGFGEQTIGEVLRNFTDIAVPDVGLCGAFRTPSEDRQFELFSCSNRESVLVDASNVDAQWSAELVLDCIADLSTRQTGPAAGFAETSLDRTTLVPFGGELSRWTPTDLPVLLGREGFAENEPTELAFIDVGVVEAEDCARFIDLEEPRGPAVVILDTDGGEHIVPLPFELDNGNGPGSISGVEILGETVPYSGGAYLLITRGDHLWSLNISSSEWSLLYDPAFGEETTDQSPLLFGSITLSNVGDRLYQPTNQGLRILQLAERLDGTLGVLTAAATLDAPDNFQTQSFDLVEVNYADNGVLFITDSAGQLWRLEPPVDRIQQPPEFIEDFGGVGTARVR